MADGRDLTPTEYLALLYITLFHGSKPPMTLADIGRHMHPHPSAAPTQTLGVRGLARMAQNANNGNPISGTLAMTDKSVQAVIEQRNKSLGQIDDQIDFCVGRAEVMRDGKPKRERDAKEYDRLAEFQRTLRRRIMRLFVDVVKTVPITDGQRETVARMLADDAAAESVTQESGVKPAVVVQDLPSPAAPKPAPKPAPKRGRPPKMRVQASEAGQ